MKGYWKFITAASDDPAAWWWVQCENRQVVHRAQQPFPSFPACVLDASAHGFVPSACFEILRDRRKAPRLAA